MSDWISRLALWVAGICGEIGSRLPNRRIWNARARAAPCAARWSQEQTQDGLAAAMVQEADLNWIFNFQVAAPIMAELVALANVHISVELLVVLANVHICVELLMVRSGGKWIAW